MSKRDEADVIVRNHVLLSLGGGLIPVPLLDLAAVTGLQVSMLERLADRYGVTYTRSIGRSFVTALTGSTAAKLGSSLLKAIPGVGTLIGGVAMSITSGASTYAVGQVAIRQFEANRDLWDLDLDDARKAYSEAFEKGKEVVVEMQAEEEVNTDVETSEAVLDALEKLGRLKEIGLLSDEEFEAQKKKLLERL